MLEAQVGKEGHVYWTTYYPYILWRGCACGSTLSHTGEARWDGHVAGVTDLGTPANHETQPRGLTGHTYNTSRKVCWLVFINY